jgi:dipeptide/tripeptide permease
MGNRSFFRQVRSFEYSFWILNIIEMLERLSYYGVRVVIPIYIAQADEIHGLHFSQLQKGQIFMWWALVQSLIPMFSGGFADRYGYKKTLTISFILKISGYLLMATQREFYPFLGGTLVLATGTAFFKPGIQGSLVQTLSPENSSVGWGIFYMLINIGAFLGAPLAHFMYGISWAAVFYASAGIISLNLLMLLTYPEIPSNSDKTVSPLHVIKTTLNDIFEPKLLIFIIIMSGFWLVFMQLFDMLPNFIADWVDSSDLVVRFNLPSFMLRMTDRGLMVSQEWLINANSAIIILTVVIISWLVSRMRRVTSIFIGITITSAGLIVSGYFMSGYLTILGILLFSIGEMLASPKMNEYLGIIAPPGKKGQYMGYANIPLAIGWAYGSFLGGTVYDKMGDKANLAIRYLQEFHQMSESVTRPEAMAKLVDITGLTFNEATLLLWNTYHPYTLWTRFTLIGFVSALGIFIFSYYVNEEKDKIK